MKRILLLCLAIPFLSFSQNSKLELGVNLGPEISGFKSSTSHASIDKKYIGYTTGLNFQYNFSKLFSLRTELNFVGKGENSKYNDPQSYYTQYQIKNTYIEIPILLRVKTNGTLSFFANTGPYLSFSISGKTKYNERLSNDTYEENSTKEFTIGWQYGAGVGFNITENFYIPLEVRFSHYLYNGNYGLFPMNSAGLSITCGIAYRLK